MKLVVMNVPMQLAVSDKTVLMTTMVLSKPVSAKKPALKLGQNIHKKNVPSTANVLEI